MEKYVINAVSNTFKGKIGVDRENFKIEPEAKLLGVALIVYKISHATQQ